MMWAPFGLCCLKYVLVRGTNNFADVSKVMPLKKISLNSPGGPSLIT